MIDDPFLPLAERLRPSSLEDLVGQSHLLGANKPLRQAIEAGQLHSMVLWGPPGVGKTTIARLFASVANTHFITLSAVLSGVKDIREAVIAAEQNKLYNKQTVLFVDEVHRFNKAQQDAFLPHIENGTFIFIGATTENPSFELNSALISRLRVYVLKPLEPRDLGSLFDKAMLTFSADISFSDAARTLLTTAAGGDARRLLTLLDVVVGAVIADDRSVVEIDDAKEFIGEGLRSFDKKGEQFYDQISALHKSVRGSAPDAALYWLASMLAGGCDRHYIARRLVRMASEDIGNADPRALDLCLNAWNAYDRLGDGEGELALAQATLYLASAPKSNAVYNAYNQAMAEVAEQPSVEVPIHLRNAPTKLMKELGYGKQYRYAHDEPHAYATGENYLPEDMPQRVYYKPVERGLEQKIAA